MTREAPPRAPGRRIVTAAAIYFALVFGVGLVLGPVRVLWLEPVLGQTLAVACEAPFLLLAMAVAARLAPRWAGFAGGGAGHLAVGIVALILQQVADLAVGFGLRGMTLQQQLEHFVTPAGWIYAFTLVVFALAPFVAYVRARAAGTSRVAQDQEPTGAPH